MRQMLLATAAFAALSLSGCSTIEKWTGDESDAPPPPVAATAPAPATSDAEAKEMSNVMGTAENPTPPAVPVESVTSETTDATAPAQTAAKAAAPANAPKECPQVEVLPDTKSITYFDDPEGKPTGSIVARAALTDIKGGCDYSKDGVIVDIDMIMQGKISDKGRYEGRRDLEAFMTFPYFVAVMDPAGKMIDKKIMATAMRFKPQVDELDHAEKITQSIPLPDVSKGAQYTITLGFQLNRAQLEYNRGGSVREGAAPAPAATADKKSDKKAGAAPSEKTSAKDAPKDSADDRYATGDLGLGDDAMPSVADAPVSAGASGASSSDTGSTPK